MIKNIYNKQKCKYIYQNKYKYKVKHKNKYKNRKAFTLVAAIFIIVILGLLSAFIVGISAVTRNTATSAIRGTDAYFAAVSGLEWGIVQTLAAEDCPATTNLSLTQGSLKGFTVNVSCTQQAYTENPLNVKIHELLARAEYGTFGNNDYTSREIKIIIISGI